MQKGKYSRNYKRDIALILTKITKKDDFRPFINFPLQIF